LVVGVEVVVEVVVGPGAVVGFVVVVDVPVVVEGVTVVGVVVVGVVVVGGGVVVVVVGTTGSIFL